MKNRLTAAILLLLSATFLSGWRTYTDTILVGDPNAAAGTRSMTFEIGAAPNNPGFRWNNTSSEVEISNDGSTWAQVGSRSVFRTGNVADTGGTIAFVHSLKTVFADLVIHLYSYNTGTGESVLMTSGGSPDLDDFVITATGGSETTSITVTNNSGSAEDIAVVVDMGSSPNFLAVTGDGSGLTGIPIVGGTTGTLSVARGGTGVTTSTGTVNVVRSNSPTLVTPILGTPTSGTLTNTTGLPIVGGTTGTLSVGRGGTGVTSMASVTGIPIVSGTTGTLTVGRGGTGATSFAAGDFLQGAGGSAITTVGSNGAGNVVRTSGATFGGTFTGGLASATGLPIDGGTVNTLPVARGGTGSTTSSGARTNLDLGNVPNESRATHLATATLTGITSATTLRTQNGSNGAPAYSFTNSNNSGMWWNGNILWSVAGTTRMELNGSFLELTGIIQKGQNGTVGAPQYAFASSLNTGVYSPTTGQVSLAASGSQIAKAAPGFFEMHPDVGSRGMKVYNDTQGTHMYLVDNTGTTDVCSVGGGGNFVQIASCMSSIRFKKDVVDIPENIADLVYQLRPREFTWKNEQEQPDYGFIAEEVLEILPKLVHYNNDKDDNRVVGGVNYRHYTAILTKAVQMQKGEIDDQQEVIDQLKDWICVKEFNPPDVYPEFCEAA